MYSAAKKKKIQKIQNHAKTKSWSGYRILTSDKDSRTRSTKGDKKDISYTLNKKEERVKNTQDMFLKKKSKETMWENMKICSTLLVIRLTKIGAILS